MLLQEGSWGLKLGWTTEERLKYKLEDIKGVLSSDIFSETNNQSTQTQTELNEIVCAAS